MNKVHPPVKYYRAEESCEHVLPWIWRGKNPKWSDELDERR